METTALTGYPAASAGVFLTSEMAFFPEDYPTLVCWPTGAPFRTWEGRQEWPQTTAPSLVEMVRQGNGSAPAPVPGSGCGFEAPPA